MVALAWAAGLQAIEAVRSRWCRARHVARRDIPHIEFVAVCLRDLPHVVDHEDLVGQIEDEIALVLRPGQAQLHRFELEDQIVAKRAVEPEVLVFATAEQIDQGAQNREYRRLAAAALFREALLALLDLAQYPIAPDPLETICGESREALRNRVQQDAAALVQGVDREPASARGNNQRRVDKPHIPPRVAAGKFETRRKQNPASLVERLGQRGIGRLILMVADLSRNADAAVGDVAGELHGRSLWLGSPGDRVGSL